MSHTVTISLKHYLKLLYSQAVLQALEAGGVDNWSGIDWAMEQAPPSLARLEELDGVGLGARPLLLLLAPALVLRVGGRVALLGLLPKATPINWDLVIFKGLILKGIYGREMFETWYKMSALIQSGLDLSPMITHRFPIERFQEGFEVMCSGQSGKVILDWGSAEGSVTP